MIRFEFDSLFLSLLCSVSSLFGLGSFGSCLSFLFVFLSQHSKMSFLAVKSATPPSGPASGSSDAGSVGSFTSAGKKRKFSGDAEENIDGHEKAENKEDPASVKSARFCIIDRILGHKCEREDQTVRFRCVLFQMFYRN